jgi:hypothetical protein
MWPLAQDFIELPNNNKKQQNKNDDNESMDNLY